jgi:hypothetical protein
MINACIAEAYRCGLRRCAQVTGGQNLVFDARWGGRHVVAKARLANFARRLDKECAWLNRARELGIACPRVLGRLAGEDYDFLLLGPLRDDGGCRQAADWHRLVAPLYTWEAPTQGWGPLRADDLPRWRHEADALLWYRQKLRSVIPSRAMEWDERLCRSWRHRQAALIHGDLHNGNRLGKCLLDWENVALGDPLEDACRLALAQRWPLGRCLRAWGGDPSSRRADGAILRSLIESAGYSGPRRDEARRLLPLY